MIEEGCSKLSSTHLCSYSVWGFFFLPCSLEKLQFFYRETEVFYNRPTLTVSKGCPTSTPAAPARQRRPRLCLRVFLLGLGLQQPKHWHQPEVEVRSVSCWPANEHPAKAEDERLTVRSSRPVLRAFTLPCLYTPIKLLSPRQRGKCVAVEPATSNVMFSSDSWPRAEASAVGRNHRVPPKHNISGTCRSLQV